MTESQASLGPTPKQFVFCDPGQTVQSTENFDMYTLTLQLIGSKKPQKNIRQNDYGEIQEDLKPYIQYIEHFRLMAELAHILEDKRKKHGYFSYFIYCSITIIYSSIYCYFIM